MTSASQTNDANLLNRFQGREDRAAFADLHQRYVDFVYNAALRQCRDPAMAADVTQAVFLVLAKRAKSVRAAALPAWLHRVTSYTVKNAQRAERRRHRHERAAGIERSRFAMTLISNVHPQSDESESIHLLLDRAIASLPKRDRTIIIERYLCGRDLSDVASMVDASTAAMQKRLERAVARLRDYFRRHQLDVGAAGIPWPALQTAPKMAMDPPPNAAAATSIQHLCGAVMRQLYWIKIGGLGVAAISLSAVAMVAIKVTQMAEVKAPSSHPTAITPQQPVTPATQPSDSNGVYLGGDVPRPGVYALSARPMTVGQLFISAGVSLRVGDHYSMTSRSEAPPSQPPAKPTVRADDVVLQPGDVLIVSKAAAPVPSDAKLAPFTDIRWNGDAPEIQIGGKWYKWIGINQRSISQVIDAARDMNADQWQKMVGEDLVQVLNHASIYVGSEVDLDAQPLENGALKQFTHVPMTAENRRSVYTHRLEREGQ